MLSDTNVSKVHKKIKAVLDNVFFSGQISWNASKKYFIIRVLFQIILAFIPSAIVYSNKHIIDFLVNVCGKGIYVEDIKRLLVLFFIYVSIKICGIVIDKSMELFTGMHQDLIDNNIKVGMMQQTNKLDISYFDSAKFYDETLNAHIDSNAIPVLAWSVISVIGCFVQIAISSVVMVDYSILFWAMLLIFSVPSVIVERKFAKKLYDWSRERAPEERKMEYISYITTDKTYAKDIRLYGLFENMYNRYMFIWNKWYREKIGWAKNKMLFVMIVSFLPEIGTFIIMANVSMGIINGESTLGDFTLYTTMAAQLVASIWSAVSVLTQIYEYNLRITNYRKFFERKPLVNDEGTLTPAIFPKIEFRNVSFKYPYTDRYIFKNLSMIIKQKQKVALVGINGSGKTTLVKLLLRFYDVDEGEILLDGINIKEYSIRALRRIFGVMFQDYTEYAFSAKENITLSDIDNSKDEDTFNRAVSVSEVDRMSSKWKDGYDTYLTKMFSEDGEELSGGEWQKIALARALFRKAGIVILDEPNSALDPESEHKIFKKYKLLLKDCGAIFISHRLSNVVSADKIYVIENGMVIEEGTHNELLNINGRYAYLFNLQSENYR